MKKADSPPLSQYKYDAFISYRHMEPDKTAAVRLHRLLETYRVPRAVGKLLKLAKNGINDFVFSADDKQVAGWWTTPGVDAGGFVVWDLERNSFASTNCGWSGSISISGDLSKALYTYSGLTKMYDLKTGNVLYTLKNKTYAAVMTADGRRVAVSDIQTMELSILDASDGSKLHTLDNGGRLMRNLCFSPDGKTLLAYSTNGYVKLFDTASGSLILSSYYPQLASQTLRFSADGSVLAGYSLLLDAKTGDVLLSLKQGPGTVHYYLEDLSCDGSQLAVDVQTQCVDGLKGQVRVYTVPNTADLLRNIDALVHGESLTDEEKSKFSID